MLQIANDQRQVIHTLTFQPEYQSTSPLWNQTLVPKLNQREVDFVDSWVRALCLMQRALTQLSSSTGGDEVYLPHLDKIRGRLT